MFQYTTETILNDNSAIRTIASVPSGTVDTLIIDGVGLYHKENITVVYKNNYVAAEKEKVTIDLAAVATAVTSAGKVIRLRIETAQEGLVSSTYADAQLRHKKPFFYEVFVPAASTVETIANLFVKAIKKEMALTDFPYFKAEKTTDNKIKLVADDVYTRFKTVQFASVPLPRPVTAEELGSALIGWEDYVAIIDWVRDVADERVTLVKGTEGAGTVARLIKNHRIPTDANTDPFGADNGGRPIPGGEYDQITLEYVTDRRHIGGQVLGALDKSLTTHVFYVNKVAAAGKTSASDALVTAIGALGITITPAKDSDKMESGTLKEKSPKIGSKE